MATHSHLERINILLSCCAHYPAQESLYYIPRFTHRLSITKAWGIPPGQHVLDIGCGQGESSLVLAMELGPSGHVTGIDPSPPDYGTPFNLAQSHEYIAKSALGPRITFLNTDAPSLLQSPGRPPSTLYDAAVVCHSLWYFPTHESVFSLFHTLAAAKIPRIYLAEYSWEASDASQRSHILASQALALLSAYSRSGVRGRDPRRYNVQTAPDQASILEAARDAGFEVHRKGTIMPQEDFMEGHFDAKHVKGDGFRQNVKNQILPLEHEAEILGLAERVNEEMEGLDKAEVPTVRAMDSWWAVLELSSCT